MRVIAKLESIDGVFVASQSFDQLQAPCVPQLDHAVISGCGKYILIAIQGDG